MKNKTLYGFEDYKLCKISQEIFLSTGYAYASSGWQYNLKWVTKPFATGLSLYSNAISYEGANSSYKIDRSKADHKELLVVGNKLFISPHSSIPRASVVTKYTKVNSEVAADAIIIPSITKMAVTRLYVVMFIDESSKRIFYTDLYDDTAKAFFSNMPIGTNMKSIIQCSNRLDVYSSLDITDDAELMYCGDIYGFYDDYAVDVAAGNIPFNKTVFESSVQKSLSTEENQITFDNIKSIIDMFKSKDSEIHSVGLKALAALDYMKCINTVGYVMCWFSCVLKYCNAYNSTSVRFMRRFIPDKFNLSESITEYDYNLIREVIKYLNPTYDNSRIVSELSTMNFMQFDANNCLIPILTED